MCIRTLFRKLKPGVKFALALLGILLLAAAIIVACWGLEDVLPPHMKSFLVFICGWITLFVLFFSLYTHLYRWRWSRRNNNPRFVVGMIALSLLIAVLIAYPLGSILIGIESKTVFMIMIAVLTIIDCICAKPWESLDEIDRTYKSR